VPPASGSRLGVYNIQSLLGVGGMGEVYRATDTRLKRQVALKVLPASIAGDPERLARLQREAEVLAALNHPNIATIYGLEESDGTRALVMELVEGPTLADRIAQGPVPLDQVLSIVRQIADALEAAHEQGIIHRDLKPANIKIRPDGVVKVLDFGLAKTVEPPASARPSSVSGSPTLTSPALLTGAGALLGTAAYMAPEQATGGRVDKRGDIWSLGVIVYELVTGEYLFAKATVTETLAAVLTAPIPTNRLPEGIRRLVRRCLDRDPKTRLRDVGDLWLLASEEPPSPPARPGRALMLVAVGAAFAVVLTASALLRRNVGATEPPVLAPVRLQLTLPVGTDPVRGQTPMVSPDGRQVAIVGLERQSGERRVYVRAFDSLAVQPVAGTERAIYPFWSPDGRRLGFFANGTLRVTDLRTGTSQSICTAPNPSLPGIWSGDTILFTRTAGPIIRASASGGPCGPVMTAYDPTKEIGQSVAGFLADGRRFVFGRSTLGSATLRVGSLDADTVTPLPGDIGRGWLHAPWVASPDRLEGHVLYISDGALLARSLHGATLMMRAAPTTLAVGVSPISAGAALPFSVQDDVLAYVGDSNTDSRLVWYDRNGTVLSDAGPLTGFMRDVRLSSDGGAAVVSLFNVATSKYDLMLVDMKRATSSRLTYETSAFQATWSPDDTAVYFSRAAADGGADVARVVPREGGTTETVVPKSTGIVAQVDVAPDGLQMVYALTRADGNRDIYLHRFKDRTDLALLASPANEDHPRLSPDGRWLAYQSDESGAPQVYLRAFPSGDVKQAVSQHGGYVPVWRRDGRELFFLSPDGDLMVVDVSPQNSARPVPRVLFRTPIDPGAALNYFQFDVHPDNKRFVMIAPVSDVPQPIHVVLHWRSLVSSP
jgi:Tol biopolymer transport system component